MKEMTEKQEQALWKRERRKRAAKVSPGRRRAIVEAFAREMAEHGQGQGDGNDVFTRVAKKVGGRCDWVTAYCVVESASQRSLNKACAMARFPEQAERQKVLDLIRAGQNIAEIREAIGGVPANTLAILGVIELNQTRTVIRNLRKESL